MKKGATKLPDWVVATLRSRMDALAADIATKESAGIQPRRRDKREAEALRIALDFYADNRATIEQIETLTSRLVLAERANQEHKFQIRRLREANSRGTLSE